MSVLPSVDVLETIHSVMHLYRSRQFRELRDGPHQLTHMEFKVLAFFARHPGATQRDLVVHSGRDKAQIARLIQGLRQREMLDGQADEQDKRSICLHLSEQGQALFAAAQTQGQQLAKLAVEGLDSDEQRRLIEMLQRIQSNLSDDSCAKQFFESPSST